jgi:hypothetical protein
MKRETCRQSFLTFLAKFLPALLLSVSAGCCQRALLGKLGIQVGKHNRSVTAAVYGTAWTKPPGKE